MPHTLLGRAQTARILDRLPTIFEHTGEEGLVGGRQLVTGLFGFAVGERRFRPEPFLDIAASPLDEVRDKRLAVERLGRIEIEPSIKQAEQ
jgi:hypothetical protein